MINLLEFLDLNIASLIQKFWLRTTFLLLILIGAISLVLGVGNLLGGEKWRLATSIILIVAAPVYWFISIPFFFLVNHINRRFYHDKATELEKELVAFRQELNKLVEETKELNQQFQTVSPEQLSKLEELQSKIDNSSKHNLVIEVPSK